MNDRETSVVNMFGTVKTFGDEQAAILATIPVFATGFTQFSDDFKGLLETIDKTGGGSGGEADAKEDTRATLCYSTAQLALPGLAYANKTKNALLKAVFNVSETDLKRKKDAELPGAVRSIVDTAMDNETALVPYGYKPADATAVQALLGVFLSESPAPRLTKTRMATYNKAIRADIKRLSTQLKEELDPLAKSLAKTHPDFATQWKEVRKIVNVGRKAKEEEVNG